MHVWKVNPDDPDTDVAVGWYKWNKEAPILLYHKDGTATLTGFAMWASARRWAVEYLNLMGFYYRAGKFKIQQPDDPIKKKRIRRCKYCLGYKQIISTCQGEIRNDRGYSLDDCFDPSHTLGGTHPVTIPCHQCVNGFLSPRDAYESFVWEPVGNTVHPQHGYVRPRFPKLRIDTKTRKIIAIEILREENEDVRSS
jgi:hypothetical protein